MMSKSTQGWDGGQASPLVIFSTVPQRPIRIKRPWSMIAVALLSPRSGITLDFEKIISFIRAQGASVLLLPERIEFIDSMPLTETKKLIDKKALQKDIKKKTRNPLNRCPQFRLHLSDIFSV